MKIPMGLNGTIMGLIAKERHFRPEAELGESEVHQGCTTLIIFLQLRD
jgi:hypothetical protein